MNLCTADAPTTTLHRANVDWHGTAVSSIAAAATNGVAMAGVAPEANLMAVRWLIVGKCDTLDYAIDAIDYAIDNGADVINASWGGNQNSAFLEDAIQRANSAGVLIAAAAGNAGTTTPFYPAASSAANVVSVGALAPDGNLASFSNRGSWVDIAAPGHAIAAICLPHNPAGECPPPPGLYAYVPGTSFAAPHVAGVAAMVLELNPALKDSAAALRSKLLNSGVKSTKLDEGLTATGRRLNAALRGRRRAAIVVVGASARAARIDDRLLDDVHDRRVARLDRRERHRVLSGPVPQGRQLDVDDGHQRDDRTVDEHDARVRDAVRGPGQRARPRGEHDDDDGHGDADPVLGGLVDRALHGLVVARLERLVLRRQGARGLDAWPRRHVHGHRPVGGMGIGDGADARCGERLRGRGVRDDHQPPHDVDRVPAGRLDEVVGNRRDPHGEDRRRWDGRPSPGRHRRADRRPLIRAARKVG